MNSPLDSSVPFGQIIANQARDEVLQNIDKIVDALQRGNLDEVLNRKQSPQDVKNDAFERSWRTLLQQLGIDVAVALVTVLLPFITTLDSNSEIQWSVIGLMVLKTILSTAAAYVFRLYSAPKDRNQVTLPEAKQAI